MDPKQTQNVKFFPQGFYLENLKETFLRHSLSLSLSLSLNKVERETIPLEAFHGSNGGGVDQNHI